MAAKFFLRATLVIQVLSFISFSRLSTARRVAVDIALEHDSESSIDVVESSTMRELCHRHIVLETCSKLNRRTVEAFGTNADRDQTVLHAVELSEHLMVSLSTVHSFLSHLGWSQEHNHAEHNALGNEEHNQTAIDAGAFAVKCQELCERTVDSIPEGHRPPHSDLGCYMSSETKSAVCDIDVSDAVFKDLEFPDKTEAEGIDMYGENAGKFHRSVTRTLSMKKLGNIWKKHAGIDEFEFDPDLRHTANASEAAKNLQQLDQQGYPDVSLAQMTISVANMFRIYPPAQISVVDGSSVPPPETDAHAGEVESREANACYQAVSGADFRNASFFHWNVKCKCDSSQCIFGETEGCTDAVRKSVDACRKFDPNELTKADWKGCKLQCRPKDWTPPKPSPSTNDCVDHLVTGFQSKIGQALSCKQLQMFGYCEKNANVREVCPQTCSEPCAETGNSHTNTPWQPHLVRPPQPQPTPVAPKPTNTHCVDKKETGFSDKAAGKPLNCVQLRSHCMKNANIRDVCPKTCGLTCAAAPPPVPGSWQHDVAKVGVKAQAYTARALTKLGASSVPGVVKTWFGDNSEETRKEIRRVLNGVNRMLMNVEYIYPGDQCSPNTYAYVYPHSPRNTNKRGQYIYHLCKLYTTSGLGEQIETLTHEGSHHELMYTDDVCYEGSGDKCKKSYGRNTCKRLASKSSAKALKNADSFCYFINDAAR